MRFTISQGIDPRSTMIVETMDGLSDKVGDADGQRLRAAIEGIRAFMADSRCPIGLIFTEDECVVLRDTYSSMDPVESIKNSHIATAELLEVLGPPRGPLSHRVERWLELLTRYWPDAVPTSSGAAEQLIYAMVPAVAEGTVHPWASAA